MSSCYLEKFQMFVPPEYKIVWILETISSSKHCDVKHFVSKSLAVWKAHYPESAL